MFLSCLLGPFALWCDNLAGTWPLFLLIFFVCLWASHGPVISHIVILRRTQSHILIYQNCTAAERIYSFVIPLFGSCLRNIFARRLSELQNSAAAGVTLSAYIRMAYCPLAGLQTLCTEASMDSGLSSLKSSIVSWQLHSASIFLFIETSHLPTGSSMLPDSRQEEL